jgi:hypothetical protein
LALDREVNDWYQGLFRKMKGDGVLQIGYLDGKQVEKIALLLGRPRNQKEAVPHL